MGEEDNCPFYLPESDGHKFEVRHGGSNSTHKQLTRFYHQLFSLFKLAVRMRNMRTTGASKNRDWPDINGSDL